MTILLTGSGGAIGRFVLERLAARDETVVALDLRLGDAPPADGPARVVFEQGDIRDDEHVRKVIRKHRVKRIAHLAAALPDQCEAHPVDAVDVNVRATALLCDAAVSAGVQRFVFASSKGVYRRVEGRHAHPEFAPLDESYPIGPQRVYDITKYAAEQLGLRYAAEQGLDFMALRFASTYGPGRGHHGGATIRSAMVEDAFFGRPRRIDRGGDQSDDFVYTRDIAQAIDKALTAEGVKSRIFNIGSGRLATLRDGAATLTSLLPEADLSVGPGLDYGTGTGRYCLFDITRARNELGYEPEFDYGQGIADYVAILKRQQLAPA